MFALISFLTIFSVLQITVLGDASKISDVQACIEFCSLSNSIGSFKDRHCTCENFDNKDTQDVFRESRQVEQVDPNLYSKDLTDEERTARCTLGSRNRLRHHDADRVVKYFVNDGPSRGHSYFVGAANANDGTEKECKSESNPSTESYRNSDDSNSPESGEQVYELVEDSSYRPDYSNAFVGAPYDPYNPIYFAPMAVNPYEHVMDNTYNPLLGSRNYILNPPIHSMRTVPHDRLLGAKLPRRTIRPRLSALKHFSNALLGLVRAPVNEGLLGAHSLLHSLTRPDLTAYSAPYISDVGTIGRSTAENIITEANPIVGIDNENSQISRVDSEPSSENNSKESFDTKKFANLIPPIQRTNIPMGGYRTIPYNQQYFMPLYPPQNNPRGIFSNTMPKAYVLKPVKLVPQTTSSTQQPDIVSMPKPQDSSNCETNTSSDSKDNSTNSTNETTEKSNENTDSTGSSITKRDSKGKTLNNKNETK